MPDGIFVSSTELDSHANTVVVGKQTFVFSHSGQYANVQAFTEKVKVLPQVPIVDAVIAYDCPSSGETYLFVVRNALCVQSMEINLIPPFIMREAGLVISTTPNIHCDKPTVADHSIFDEESGLRIPLTLNGIFSTFNTRSVNEDEIENVENYQTIFLTPDSNVWNQYDESYKMNEDPNLDNRGRMVLPSTPTQHCLVRETKVSAIAGMTEENDMAMHVTDNFSQQYV